MKSLGLAGAISLSFDVTRAFAASIDLNFLRIDEIRSFVTFERTAPGRLSGITYDPSTGKYTAVSDDRRPRGMMASRVPTHLESTWAMERWARAM